MRKYLLSLVGILLGLSAYAASTEKVLWEGSVAASWGGEPSVAASECADFALNGEIIVYYTLDASPDGGYYSLGLIGNWRNYSWGGADGVTANTSKKSYYLESEADVTMAKSDGLKIMGNGLTVTKIAYVQNAGPIDKTLLLTEPVVVNSQSSSIEYTYDKLEKAGAVTGGGILVEYQTLNPSEAFVTFLHQGNEPTDPDDEEAVNAAKYIWVEFSNLKVVNTDVTTQNKTTLLVLNDETMSEINSYSKNLIIQCGMVRVTSIKVIAPADMPDTPDLAIVTLDKETATLEIGATEQLAATVKPSDAKVTWTSSNPEVATVDANGLVTAVGGGTATITASIDGASASCEITVVMIKITWLEKISGQPIYADQENITAHIGDTPRLVITTIPEDAKITLKAVQDPDGMCSFYDYTKSGYDKKEAEFSLKAAGTVTITATMTGTEFSKTFTLTSVDYEKPCLQVSSSSSSNPSYLNVLAGTEFNITATVRVPKGESNADYKTKNFTWTLSDSTVAVVKSQSNYSTSSSIYVEGFKTGKVTVYASLLASDGTTTLVGETDVYFTGHGELSHQFYFQNDRGGSWTSKYGISGLPSNGVIEDVTLVGNGVDFILHSATNSGSIPYFAAGQKFSFKVNDPNVRIFSVSASPTSSAPALVTFGDKTTCSNGVNEKTSWHTEEEYGVTEVTFTVLDENDVKSLIYWTPKMYKYAVPELVLDNTELSGSVKETVQLTASLANVESDVVLPATTVWSTADPTVASVDQNGLVTLIGNGTTEITADYNGTKSICTVSVLGTTAIDAVGVDANAPAEYYNLQGVRVDGSNLTPGVYVVRKGNDVKKVIVK